MTQDLVAQAPSFNPLALLPKDIREAKDFATEMSKSDLIPKHLQGKPGDCLMITMQAYRWMMDPFVVANCTSVVHGRLCYEGKLIAAVLSTMNATEGPLEYDIKGEGQNASITVKGKPKGSKKYEVLTGTVKGWRTYGKDKNTGQRIDNNWDKDPISMLVYRGTRQWARLYAPAGFLGVYTRDEMEDGNTDEIEVAIIPPSVEVPQRKREAPPEIQDGEIIPPKPAPAPVAEPTPTPPAAVAPSNIPDLPFETPSQPAPSTPVVANSEPGEPLTDGMQRILKTTQSRVNVSDSDLAAHFPRGIGKANIQEAIDWVKANGQTQTQ